MKTCPGLRAERLLPLLLGAMLFAGCSDDRDPLTADTPPAPTPATAAPGVAPDQLLHVEWDDLIPLEWQPEKLLADFDVDNLEDDDPRADELMEKLKALWAEAPVVPALDGQRIRLPGFVVPLDFDATEITEFLLVPYFGACIHVPPPPPNQTVLVVTAADAPFRGGLFDTVWVEGRMHVEHFGSELGDAGYRIDGATISPYEEVE